MEAQMKSLSATPFIGKSLKLAVILQLLLFLCAGTLFSQIPLETAPSWRSSDTNNYSTGAAWGDVDGDGWLELAISNGNDMDDDPNVIYDNDNGVLETSYSWSSNNNDYSGKCALGDIDHDGGLDFVVANYGYPSGGGWAKRLDDLYMSVGGIIRPNPVWNSAPADSDNTFGLDLGDVDGDGDLDLATANGDAYTSTLMPNKVYYNNGTIFEDIPSWTSDELLASYDAKWGDVDRDGDLDLAILNSNGPLQVYYNTGSSLETSASWTSQNSDDFNTMCWGDMNGDGWLDLAASSNTQLGGTGRYYVYLNNNGTLIRSPVWQSNESLYGSSVAWADIDFDGDLDLAAGGWWARSAIYENENGMLTTSPSWRCTSTYSSVAEEMVWGDVDGDGLRNVIGESHAVDGSLKLFYLNHYPAHTLDSVYVDGTKMARELYCFDLRSGWVSLPTAPSTSVEFFYTFSRDLDMALSNWDRENFVFYNTATVEEDVSVVLHPQSRQVTPGENFAYSATIVNNTASSTTISAMARVRLPGGNPFGGNPVYGPEDVDLLPFEAVDIEVSHVIPLAAPDGQYTYIFLIGYLPSDLVDRDVVRFTVE
jgi:hypothetical protein